MNSLFETITERCEDCSEFREHINLTMPDHSYRWCNLKHYYHFVYLNQTVKEVYGCPREEESLEVIGNIYENPELLKEEK